MVVDGYDNCVSVDGVLVVGVIVCVEVVYDEFVVM